MKGVPQFEKKTCHSLNATILSKCHSFRRVPQFEKKSPAGGDCPNFKKVPQSEESAPVLTAKGKWQRAKRHKRGKTQRQKATGKREQKQKTKGRKSQGTKQKAKGNKRRSHQAQISDVRHRILASGKVSSVRHNRQTSSTDLGRRVKIQNVRHRFQT